jgi:hypothetical protein
MRERPRLDQTTLCRLYAISVIVVMLTTAELAAAQPRHDPPACAMIAATILFLASVIVYARRDLNQHGRRTLYAISMVAAVVIALGSFVFVPAIW